MVRLFIFAAICGIEAQPSERPQATEFLSTSTDEGPTSPPERQNSVLNDLPKEEPRQNEMDRNLPTIEILDPTINTKKRKEEPTIEILDPKFKNLGELTDEMDLKTMLESGLDDIAPMIEMLDPKFKNLVELTRDEIQHSTNDELVENFEEMFEKAKPLIENALPLIEKALPDLQQLTNIESDETFGNFVEKALPLFEKALGDVQQNNESVANFGNLLKALPDLQHSTNNELVENVENLVQSALDDLPHSTNMKRRRAYSELPAGLGEKTSNSDARRALSERN